MGKIEDLQITSLEDILELQRQLDEAISKKRDSGFVPRERDYKDIILSMIAEIIEFNEETEGTHKTWKEKDFNIDNMKEEAVDILFFFAQLINKLEEDKKDISLKDRVLSLWERAWKEEDIGISNELELIGSLTRIGFTIDFRIIDVTLDLARLYRTYGITKEDLYELYYFKWLKNMGRIEGDWTK